MKKTSIWQAGFFKLRVSVTLLLFSAGIYLTLLGSGLFAAAEEQQAPGAHSGIQFGQSYHNDVSPALRDLPAIWPPQPSDDGEPYEANLNPRLPLPFHVDVPDPVVERTSPLKFLLPNIPAPILNFDGVPFPGVTCNCAPPDTNGAVGLTQYVQSVNKGYQVFNKTTGASVLGPTAIATVWTGFGGVCQNNTRGDPVVLYDRMANRWLISQFAGTSIPTDECIAISTTSDATGTYNRYAFHLGSNFFDYPHFGIWPDGYYMAMNIFNSAATAFLGPQAFAFDRTAMLAGLPATFVTPGITGGASEASFLPSDLDGSIAPPAGTANPFVSFPATGVYKVRLFHADFVTPANTTFNLLASPPAAGFTQLCFSSCVPQLGTTNRLDGIGDRLMFRLAYRKFADGHEAVVGNYTVSAGGVAGVRWFEIRAVTTAPAVFQESTYQPDTTWRWMGSAGMDQMGNLAIGYAASSATINPQIRYAGRHVTDPINTLGQGEATLFSGTGSQTGALSRWGDYSALTIDPVDDCTFWYTQEYLATNGSFNWRTRIGSFKFATCPGGATTPTPTPTVTPGTPTPSPTLTPSPTPTPTTTPTPTPGVCTESFDGVTAPALPAGWVAFNASAGVPPDNGILWVTNTITPDSAPNSAFIDDQNGVSDKSLDSRPIVINSAAAKIRFRNFFNVEYDPPSPGPEEFWDGYVLEISINGGPYADITDPAPTGGGGTFVTGAYTGEINGIASNPLAGRMAWCGENPGYINTEINLGSHLNGQTVKLRFRMGTDLFTGGPGVHVDGLIIDGGSCGPITPSTPTPTPTVTPSTPTPTPTVTPSTPTPTPTVTPPSPTPSATVTPATPTPTPSTTIAPSPTATATATPIGTPTSTPSATATATATPSPTATPASQTVNLSTRMRVQTGDNVGIGGFIITGTVPKHVLLRAIGPSLTPSGVPNALADPVLELHGPGAFATINNDNWRDDPAQQAAILATGLAPTNNLESAIDATLNPGAYTAVVRGKNNATGVALVEVFDVNQAVTAKLANISTRAFVSIGDDIVIAGFILGNNSGNDRIVARGIGPSLAAFGVSPALANPTLELRNSNGAITSSNNDWQDNPAQAAELTAAGLAPTNPLESGIAATLPPGLYTALLAGVNNGTGVGLVEVYDRGAP